MAIEALLALGSQVVEPIWGSWERGMGHSPFRRLSKCKPFCLRVGIGETYQLTKKGLPGL